MVGKDGNEQGRRDRGKGYRVERCKKRLRDYKEMSRGEVKNEDRE